MSRGGYRPGSGPKKGTKYKTRSSKNEPKDDLEKENKQAAEVDLEADVYLRTVWNDPKVDTVLRIKAAEIVFRGSEKKGKKEEKKDKARTAASGKFAPSRPPLSVVKNGCDGF